MNAQKKLGLGSGVAVCMGLIVATSCLVSLGQGFGLAGNSFIIALAIVVVLNSFIGISFAELNRMMPDVTGGLGQYMLVGLGPWASIMSNISAYFITQVLASSVELAMCGIVISGLFPSVPPLVFSVAVLLILFVLNLFGVDIFAKVQNITVILLIGSMAVLGIIGFFKLGSGVPITAAEYAPPMGGIADAVSLSAIAFWLFIGVEFIIPVAKDMKNSKRNVLLSMILALIILFVVQSVLGMGMSNYVSTEVLLSAEMPHIAYAENLIGRPGVIWMSIVTILAAVSTLNTVLPATGKILQGMAEEKMVPSPLIKMNKKNVPWLGMLVVVVLDMVMLLSGFVNSSGLINIILAGSCFWIASYTLTHLNVLALRKRYPNAMRSKNLVLAGVPQAIGIVGCVYMIWNIASDPGDRALIYKIFGILFAILAVYAFVWVKAVLKTNPFRPVYIGTMNVDKTVLPKVKTSL
ncbi:MAG: APC family permease [Oscillospiraceae bacterium]|nr:APC family permease [Oscillospiraceae bacterium]